MENKNNIDWNVNLNYITKDDLKTFYKFFPDEDQTTTDENKTDLTGMAIAIASERINTITGNQIEVIGFKNLNETQQTLVKRATARMTLHYLTDGMSFIRSSVSISGNGLSSSISPPSEPDYVLMEVYNLLQQANLHTPRKAINNPILCNTDNFNTPSIFDESDSRVITWDSGNKTFLRKEGLIAGTGIKIDDVSDTIPKLKIHVDSNIDSLWEVNKDNPNFIVPKDDKGISANDKRIIDVGTPTFLSDATTKEYVDKKQDKLIAGENIKIDEKTNTISATGGSGESLWEIDPNSSNIIQPKEKRIITSNNTRIVDIADPTQPQDGVNLRTLDKKLEDKMDKDQFKYAFGINTIGTEIPNLETTNKTIVGAINELKEKIKDKKFSNDYFKYNSETNEILLNDEENSLLCRDLLENNEYKLLKTQNKKLLQAINEILEKQPQPSPIPPSGSNWKEIGTREKNKWDNWQITYDFQENKHYRVYYSWSIYNPVYTIQEFIITDKKIAGVQIQTFNDNANIVILSVQHAKWITIYTGKGNLKGNVWKLEELQE